MSFYFSLTWEEISPDLKADPIEVQVSSGGPIHNYISGEEYYIALFVILESPIKEGVLTSVDVPNIFKV